MKNPYISIIVTTKNESANIKKLLQSIVKQTYLNKEIIVVDNNSKDQTKNIARKFTKFVYNKGPERSAQRNFGAKKAKGPFILILDADMTLEKSVLKDLAAKATEGRKVVIIPEKSVGKGFWADCRALERRCYVGDNAIECPRFFEKKIFLSIGGFNEEIYSGEDFELKAKLKKKNVSISRIDSFIVHNEGRLKLSEHLQKMRFYGKNERKSLSGRGFTLDTLIQISPIRPAYIRNWREMVKDPLHTVGVFMLKFLELIAISSSFIA